MLKADLHIHTKEDPIDRIKYTAKDMIDNAYLHDFDIIAITLHCKFFDPKPLVKYAKGKGILLIPGVELIIQGKHVLVYNGTRKQVQSIKSLDDLRELRKINKNLIVIAPHPFFGRNDCVGADLIENLDIFDGIEYSHFYYWKFNRNKRAVEVAGKHKKALIGTSDLHFLRNFGYTYALIDAKKDVRSVVQAIRNQKVKLVSKQLELWKFLLIVKWLMTPMGMKAKPGYRKLYKSKV